MILLSLLSKYVCTNLFDTKSSHIHDSGNSLRIFTDGEMSAISETGWFVVIGLYSATCGAPVNAASNTKNGCMANFDD